MSVHIKDLQELLLNVNQSLQNVAVSANVINQKKIRNIVALFALTTQTILIV